MKVEEVFNQQEIKDFMGQGFTYEQIQQTINETEQGKKNPLLQSYNQVTQARNTDPRSRASNSYISGSYGDNLIQWQLELDSILERIEHMLRGDKPTWEKGSIIWMPANNEAEKVLNNFGVVEIMRVLSNYVNRNTVLSNYDEDLINSKMYDLGNELTDLLYLKYESMGLNDIEKRKLYPILIRQVVDIVHSAYLRALHGGERESLREARQVTQSEAVNPYGVTVNAGTNQRERGMLNPMRWFGSKHK